MISRLVRRLAFRAHSFESDPASAAPLDLSDHVVVLGWGPQTPTVAAELMTAADPGSRSTIVVMGEEASEIMQAAIVSRLPSEASGGIVCCTGHPGDAADLARLSPGTARAVVVLPAGDRRDATVLQTLGALARHAASAGGGRRYRVVTALHDPSNSDIVRAVIGEQVQLVMIDAMVTRLVAHTCLHPGVSLVFEELLSNAGHEVYLASQPQLTGLTFGEALYCFEQSTPIGLCAASGVIRICPPFDTRIAEGDRLIAISASQNTMTASIGEELAIDEASIRPAPAGGRVPRRILVLGWNRRAPLLLQHLDALVPPGSMLTVVHGSIEDAAATRHALRALRHATASFERISEGEPRLLEQLAGAGYDRIIVLSQPDSGDALEAAATTLAVAQRLRDSAWRSDRPFAIVAETGDHPGLRARQWTSHDELLVIDRLVALMVAQIAAAGERAAVFHELLDAGGAELAWTPASAYVSSGAPVSFYAIVESARRRGEIALGYRARRAQTFEPEKRIVLNPDKRNRVMHEEGDQILVLRQDDHGVTPRSRHE
jgi:ion channel POLLUX/CASTOR